MSEVEMTGATVADAKEKALDALGISEDEAEFEILEEPTTGLFGRVKRDARVRAWVAPVQPRPKTDGRRSSKKDAPKSESSKPEPADAPKEPVSARPERSPRSEKPRFDGPHLSVDEHAAAVAAFVEGLAEAFGTPGSLTTVAVDDDTREVQLAGDGLGLLIGPRGSTLSAVQTLARTAAQRGAGELDGRVNVEIGGYREARKVALEAFVVTQAAAVVEDGKDRALEPMGSNDRKTVHDAVNDIDGVRTVSEGEDPRRRVVLVAE